MSILSPDLDGALATLATRWGSAAIRLGNGRSIGAIPTEGALAPRLELPAPTRAGGSPVDGSIVPTGFAALDAALGLGGLPRLATATFRGDASSGKTTLALRLVAEAQVQGAIAAYLDLAGALDPVEAVARGVDLAWLVVLAPRGLDEGLAMAGALLQGRAVDLLVIDLPDPGVGRHDAAVTRDLARRAAVVRRLAALARRAGTLLVVLEPPALPATFHGTLAESSGLRLELARRAWIRLGRDVVGQATEVFVAKNRYGPPGRRVRLEILYADGTDRDGCLLRADLLAAGSPAAADATGDVIARPSNHNAPTSERTRHAIASSRLAPSPAPAGAGRLLLVPGRVRGPRGPALGAGDRPRREPQGARLRGPAGDAARGGA